MKLINWELAGNPLNYLTIGVMLIMGAFLVDGLLMLSAKAGTLSFNGANSATNT